MNALKQITFWGFVFGTILVAPAFVYADSTPSTSSGQASSPQAQTPAPAVPVSASQALLYVTGTINSIASLRAHVSARDIVSPQVYVTTPAGVLKGKPIQEILDIATTAGAKVMPLIANQNFNQVGVHTFLKSTKAQNALISSLIKEAKKYKYIGYQYDFEHIIVTDRDLYSAFVAKSVPIFHKAGLKLSVAVSPHHSATDDPLAYGPGSWQNWTGAFDYKALGASADFISVMAYDDSNSIGPVASLPWFEGVINYSLAHIPPEKISIGIPAYVWIWDTATNKRVYVRGYSVVAPILTARSYVDIGRNSNLGVPYVTYKKNNHQYTAWYEDAKSFEQKLSLAKTKGISAYSLWAVGLEDPDIWKVKMASELPSSNVAIVQ